MHLKCTFYGQNTGWYKQFASRGLDFSLFSNLKYLVDMHLAIQGTDRWCKCTKA